MTFWLTKIEWHWEVPDVTLYFASNPQGGNRKILCRSVELLHIEDLQHPPDIGFMPEPVRDHPVLWPFADSICNLFVASAPQDPYTLIGHLAAVHDHFENWFPFSTWFARKNVEEQIDLLRSGSGCFATGPRRAMEKYRDILESYGCRPTLVSNDPRTDENNEVIRDRCPFSCMVFDPQIYVVAMDFEETAT